MILIEFNNLNNLNVSLQVGDAVYARPTVVQAGSNDAQTPVGTIDFVGILRAIQNLGNSQHILTVDDNPTAFPFSIANPYIGNYYTPNATDFIMFSKYDQSDGEVLGYYAEAKFVNNSKIKAELYAISSEITVNSK